MLNTRGRRHLPAVLALLVCATAASAQQDRASLVRKLDSIAASGVIENRAAGIAAAVIRGNDTLLLKGYGKADVEWNVPMPVDAMFEIGSVTKQFTAVAIYQLRDEGKLSLDDDVTKWLPDFDTRGNTVPIRRLLDHTSGIKGITEMPEFGILVSNPRFPRDSAYALIKRYPFEFRTGEAQIYNNSAFWLLGLIVEKASGGTYEDYVEKKFFAPLGMTRSSYCNSGENIERRAHGYQYAPPAPNARAGGPGGPQLRRAPTNVHTWPFSAGSLCSTAGDLVTWIKALHGGKLLSAKSYAELITPSKLNDGTPIRYNNGLSIGRDALGLNYIGHGGSIGGFTAEAGWYPDSQIAVVVLMNSNGNIDPGAIGRELAAEMLPWAEPKDQRFTGDATPLLGTYKGPSRGREMVVVVTQTAQGPVFSANGSPARPLPWVDGLTFRQGNSFLRFVRDRNGAVTELRFDGGGGFYVLKRQ